ncbi:MAG: LytTR family DNA-binding domain-containing protein [Betaproteobacteria bacterium]
MAERWRLFGCNVVTAYDEHAVAAFAELDTEAYWQIHRGTIVNLRAIARVERDWRDQPVILLRRRPKKLAVSRTFATRFKAM